jgi:hypothetical protein
MIQDDDDEKGADSLEKTLTREKGGTNRKGIKRGQRIRPSHLAGCNRGNKLSPHLLHPTLGLIHAAICTFLRGVGISRCRTPMPSVIAAGR